MSAVLPCAELVAPVANMLAAAVAAGRVGVPSQPAPSGAAAGDPPAETSQEVSGEGRGQGGGPARQPDRADLHSAVDDGPGPGAHRVDGPAVCAGLELSDLLTSLPRALPRHPNSYRDLPLAHIDPRDPCVHDLHNGLLPAATDQPGHVTRGSRIKIKILRFALTGSNPGYPTGAGS